MRSPTFFLPICTYAGPLQLTKGQLSTRISQLYILLRKILKLPPEFPQFRHTILQLESDNAEMDHSCGEDNITRPWLKMQKFTTTPSDNNYKSLIHMIVMETELGTVWCLLVCDYNFSSTHFLIRCISNLVDIWGIVGVGKEQWGKKSSIHLTLLFLGTIQLFS